MLLWVPVIRVLWVRLSLRFMISPVLAVFPVEFWCSSVMMVVFHVARLTSRVGPWVPVLRVFSVLFIILLVWMLRRFVVPFR